MLFWSFEVLTTKKQQKMEQKLQRNIVWFFSLLLLTSFLGFYPTYLVKAPTFEGFKTAHHFHGLMALLWILLLIVQPLLIRLKKNALHKQVGKLSYVIMPLLMVSLFFVAKASYEAALIAKGRETALAGMTNGIPDLIYLGFFFTMAMIYRKQVSIHMRFMACTGFMMLGPGLGRMMVVAFGMPVPVVIVTIVALTALLPLTWLIFDIKNKKPLFPLISYLVITVMVIITGSSGQDPWWQSIAGWISETLF